MGPLKFRERASVKPRVGPRLLWKHPIVSGVGTESAYCERASPLSSCKQIPLSEQSLLRLTLYPFTRADPEERSVKVKVHGVTVAART